MTHATSFYRYVLPAFMNLYGIEFVLMSDEQARQLNARIFENYKGDSWLRTVITESADIGLMFIDPYWARLKFERTYEFAVPILNVTTMVDGYHPSVFTNALDSPYEFAALSGMCSGAMDSTLLGP